MSDPITPLVHLNGTSGETLLDENRAAAQAVRAAIDALRAASPNARDYVIDPSAFPKARDEHRARLEALHVVAVDLDYIGIRIADQLNARRKR